MLNTPADTFTMGYEPSLETCIGAEGAGTTLNRVPLLLLVLILLSELRCVLILRLACDRSTGFTLSISETCWTCICDCISVSISVCNGGRVLEVGNEELELELLRSSKSDVDIDIDDVIDEAMDVEGSRTVGSHAYCTRAASGSSASRRWSVEFGDVNLVSLLFIAAGRYVINGDITLDMTVLVFPLVLSLATCMLSVVMVMAYVCMCAEEVLGLEEESSV